MTSIPMTSNVLLSPTPRGSNTPSRCGASESHPSLRRHHNYNVMTDMTAGFIAGFVAVALGYPMDVIKTRLQTGSHRSSGTIQPPASLYKTGERIVRKEGILSLYKGLTSPLLTLSVSSSINFAAYGFFQELYGAQSGWNAGNWMSGLSVGPIVGVISTVENHVRTQMQVDNIGKNRFRNSAHCLVDIVRYHGLSTLFKGWTVTTFKDCAYFSTYFFCYEGMKHSLSTHLGTNSQQAAIPVAGGAAGMAAWLVAYPLDCVRAKLQGQCLVRGRHVTSWDMAKKLLSKRGIQGFYVGVTPALIRASLVHSVRFSAYESVLWLLQSLATNDER